MWTESRPSATYNQGLNAEEPRHVDGARSGICRGCIAGRTLPALPRLDGEGRACAHDVRRLIGGLARLAIGVRTDRRLIGPLRPDLPGVRRAHPPPWLRADVPDFASGPPYAARFGRLAGNRRAQHVPRAAASRLRQRRSTITTSLPLLTISRPPHSGAEPRSSKHDTR